MQKNQILVHFISEAVFWDPRETIFLQQKVKDVENTFHVVQFCYNSVVTSIRRGKHRVSSELCFIRQERWALTRQIHGFGLIYNLISLCKKRIVKVTDLQTKELSLLNINAVNAEVAVYDAKFVKLFDSIQNLSYYSANFWFGQVAASLEKEFSKTDPRINYDDWQLIIILLHS